MKRNLINSPPIPDHNNDLSAAQFAAQFAARKFLSNCFKLYIYSPELDMSDFVSATIPFLLILMGRLERPFLCVLLDIVAVCDCAGFVSIALILSDCVV